MYSQITEKKFSTKEIADYFFVKPTSIHHAVCQQGHYMGMVPIKRKNGKLAWPDPKANSEN